MPQSPPSTSRPTGRAEAVLVLPDDRGSLAADLHALAEGWTTAPGEVGVAALLGDPSAEAREELHRCVDRVVTDGLGELLHRARDRGERVPVRPAWVVVRTVRGLLVSRLLGRPVDPAQVPDLVDRVLVPLLRSGLQRV